MQKISRYIVPLFFLVFSFIELYYFSFFIMKSGFSFFSAKYLLEAIMFFLVSIFWNKKSRICIYIYNIFLVFLLFTIIFSNREILSILKDTFLSIMIDVCLIIKTIKKK